MTRRRPFHKKTCRCKGPEVGEGHKCHESKVQQKTKQEALPGLLPLPPYVFVYTIVTLPRLFSTQQKTMIPLKPKSGHVIALLQTLQHFTSYTVEKSKVLTKNCKAFHDPALSYPCALTPTLPQPVTLAPPCSWHTPDTVPHQCLYSSYFLWPAMLFPRTFAGLTPPHPSFRSLFQLPFQ